MLIVDVVVNCMSSADCCLSLFVVRCFVCFVVISLVVVCSGLLIAVCR